MPARILVSYAYLKDNPAGVLEVKRAVEERGLQLLLDSGAFTAWRADETIHIDDYCRFVEKLSFDVWGYFALDVIGNAEATQKNYRLMLERGFRPIPVFTRGSSLDLLEEYYASTDIVAVGGLVGTAGNRGFVKGIMKEIAGRKCHWLGFTPADFINKYLPFSVDSSSWLSSRRFGRVSLYLGRGKFRVISRDDFRLKPDGGLVSLLEGFGVSSMQLRKKEAWRGRGSIALVLGSRSSAKYSKDLLEKFGVSFFLSMDGAKDDLRRALDAFDFVEGVRR